MERIACNAELQASRESTCSRVVAIERQFWLSMTASAPTRRTSKKKSTGNTRPARPVRKEKGCHMPACHSS
eukprot:scaffold96948_cov33-Tisochrysis_lutea.AAC.2